MSPDKQAAINRDRLSLSDAPASVVELIRDPYILEFTGLPERPDHLESDLEKAILDHLQAFLLELGEGFCFEARRYLTALPSPETIKALIERDQAMREQAQFQLPATP